MFINYVLKNIDAEKIHYTTVRLQVMNKQMILTL